MTIFGRSEESARLHQAFQASLNYRTKNSNHESATCSLVLLSGPMGVGKRTLVDTIVRPHVKAVRGVFLSGRCQPQHRNRTAPLECSQTKSREDSGLLGVFRSIFRDLVQHADDALTVRIQMVLEKEFPATNGDHDWEYLKDTFPEISKLRSPVQQVSCSRPGNIQEPVLSPFPCKHFSELETSIRAVVRLIYAISSCTSLVVFLDQIQLADTASLDVCRMLWNNENSTETVESTQPTGLLLIASYRDDVSLVDHAATFIESFNLVSEARAESERTTRISLSNLARDDAYHWALEQCIEWTDRKTQSLADASMELSGGNPLYITFFFRLVEFANGAHGHIDATILERLRRDITSPCNTIELWRYILSRLGLHLNAVQALAVLAECQDEAVEREILTEVLGRDCTESLDLLFKLGLVQETSSEDGTQVVQFVRADIHQTVYDSISSDTKAFTHKLIARKLLERDTSDESPTVICIARHLKMCAVEEMNSDERYRAAHVALRAAQWSTRVSSFKEAGQFIELGIVMLNQDIWTSTCYSISLELHNGGAEICYSLGDFDGMDGLLDAIFAKARSFQDKLHAYTTLVYANSARNRLPEALNMALDVLRKLGEPLPLNPGKLSVVFSYLRTRWEFRGKTDHYFLTLSQATDVEKIAAAQLVNVAFMALYSIKPEFGAVAIFRILRLAVKYGMTGSAIAGFGGYGFVLCTLSKFDEGYRFGKLAVALLEQCQTQVWLPRVYLSVYGFVNYWFHPIRDALAPLQVARRLALKCGDMESHAMASAMCLTAGYLAGNHLYGLEKEARAYCQEMDKCGQTSCLILAMSLWKLLADLSGVSEESLQLTGTVKSADGAVSRALHDGNINALSNYYGFRAISCFLMSDCDKALKMIACWHKMKSFKDFLVSFFEALTLFAVARASPWRHRPQYVCRGRRLTREMTNWAKKCPANFLNKQYLMQAELAATQGKRCTAISLYDKSIDAALRHGFVHEAALAYERLGCYHLEIGNRRSAALSVERARDLYQQWGAEVLVTRLNIVLVGLA